MRLLLLTLCLLSLTVFAQPKRSVAVRKSFDQAVELYNQGKSLEALALFENCVAEDSTFSEAYLNISYIYFDQKNYIKSLFNAKKALKYNQFQSSIYIQSGKCLYHLEEYDSSIYYINKGISFGAKDEYDFIYLAKSYSKTGAHRDAIFYYSKAIEINGNNYVTYNERGAAYYELGEFEQSKIDIEKALSINPQSISAITNMARVSLALGDNETAINYIDKGIEGANDDQKVELLILKGNYYKSIGDFENASKTFDMAFQLDSENAIILNNQAAVFIEQENFESALEKCNLALDINPEMMEAYFNRGIANEMLRNVEAACLDWEQAFILGSSTAEEYLNSPICNE